MAQAAIRTAEPAAPVTPAIDRDHLKRVTFGDASLEHELLQLFDRQSELLLARMRAGDPATVATLAHTLKGSACGIGADHVAQAAHAAEEAAALTAADIAAALDRLAQAADETRAQIAVLLHTH
jgi:HPt (histidine-containing phosphotransfer) domain-containing protein